MSRVYDKNYITILPFMVNDLKLKGNELLIYACIYGFSQAEGTSYSGGLSYLMAWTQSTKQGVLKALKSLREKGLVGRIERTAKYDYQTVQTEFSAVNKVDLEVNKVYPEGVESLPADGKQSLPQGAESLPTKVNSVYLSGGKQSLPRLNKVEYKLLNNINKNNKKSTEGAKKRLSPFEGKPNITEQIETYTSSEELRESLSEFVEMRKKLRKPFTDGAFRLMLKKLTEYGKTDEERTEVINQSIVNGWQGIFPLKAQAHGKDAKNGVLNDWYELFEEGGENGTDKS